MAISHIGHAELRVVDLEASTEFFTTLLGLYVTSRTEDRVYLRAWNDWDHHTLTLVHGPTSGLAHCGWRVESEADLASFATRLGELGIPCRSLDAGAEPGQGRALRFATPSGLPLELYAGMAPYEAPPALRSPFPSHPQKRPLQASPRRFDHINFFVDDVAAEQQWLTDHLGIHHRYYMEGRDGTRVGSWLSRTNLTHEIALSRNGNQSGALLNHVAYYVDTPQELINAADVLGEHDANIEWGPGRHATSGAMFLYVFEPSGNRIELWTGGFLIFDPDWSPRKWDAATASRGLELWGSKPPADTFYTYGTSLLEDPLAAQA